MQGGDQRRGVGALEAENQDTHGDVATGDGLGGVVFFGHFLVVGGL